MPKPLQPSPTALLHTAQVRIPRGHDHFWAVIRDLDRVGPWSVPDVDAGSNAATASVRDYVFRLVRAGIAVEAGTAPGYGTRTRLYRLARCPFDAPRLRRDGSSAPPSAQQHMWTAMRRLGQFSFRDVAFHAATDLITIADITVQTYIGRLTAAGYLMVVVKGGPARPAIYRLKPVMAEGRPKAPRVLRSHLIFDPNIDAVVGEAQAEEVST